MERAIITLLLATTAITDVVDTRIKPVQQAQFAELPFITLRVSDYETIGTYNGSSGLAKTTVQIDAWAESYKAATDLQNAIKNAIQYQQGTYGGITVKLIVPQGKAELHNQTPDGSEFPTYCVTADYVVTHNE